MTELRRFHAFVATLIALVIMFLAACGLAWVGKSVEALGISGALTGLIGLAGVLAGGKQHSDEVKVTNRPGEEIPVTDQGAGQ